MADLKAKITNVVVGDNFEVIRTIDNISVGQNIVEAWFTVRENHWDATSLFQKHITTTNVANQGHIYDDGTGDLVSNMQFNLQQSETLLLSPFFTYVYDLQVKTSAGFVYTPELGTLTANPSITSES